MNLHAHYHVSKFDQRQGGYYCNRGLVFKKNLFLVISISVKAVYKKNHQVKLIIRKQLIDRPVSNIYNKQSLAAYYGGQSVHARIRSNRP